MIQESFKKERIVVTGIGLVTPLGLTREESWEKIKQGKSLLEEKNPPGLDQTLNDFVRFSPFQYSDGSTSSLFFSHWFASNNIKEVHHRIFPLALSCVKEALNDAGLELFSQSKERVGCTVSVSKPIFPPFYSPDSLNHYLKKELELLGPSSNLIAACATGIHSLRLGSCWLKENLCDLVIAGSVESSLNPLFISGFKRMGLLSNFPCPFDLRRNGFMIGEGAGIFILERRIDALRRDAKIYAELKGCAIGSDTHHPTKFDSSGNSIAFVLKKVLGNASVDEEEIDYINCHGTGTFLNDLTETRAIKTVFKKKAYALSLSSTKSATGHLLGASGSVEAGISCLSIRDHFIPPTLNLENADPECDLDYTAKQGKQKEIDCALSLSFGFGGPIGAILFSKI
ncbi:MAG: beta-ketoacyl-[acyl-carrier-protein] synthase family protein [Elusimicrobia bacterium]|nr:beta-ketoacyl-[acyl-carrier-protein] synthase family protein [Elusimicrobiota bacterium]